MCHRRNNFINLISCILFSTHRPHVDHHDSVSFCRTKYSITMRWWWNNDAEILSISSRCNHAIHALRINTVQLKSTAIQAELNDSIVLCYFKFKTRLYWFSPFTGHSNISIYYERLVSTRDDTYLMDVRLFEMQYSMHIRWDRSSCNNESFLLLNVFSLVSNGNSGVVCAHCRSVGRWIDDDIVDASVYVRRKQNQFEIQCLGLRVGYVRAHGSLCNRQCKCNGHVNQRTFSKLFKRCNRMRFSTNLRAFNCSLPIDIDSLFTMFSL